MNMTLQEYVQLISTGRTDSVGFEGRDETCAKESACASSRFDEDGVLYLFGTKFYTSNPV